MIITDVSDKIQKGIEQLSSGRKLLESMSDALAVATGIYEKKLAMTLMGLKNGKEYELDGEKISNPPASIMEKVARGICWQEKMSLTASEGNMTRARIGMSSLEAELNAWQSIFRHLSNV